MNSWKDWRKLDPNHNKLIHPSGNDPNRYDAYGILDANSLLERIPDIATKKTLDYGCGNARMLRHMTKYPIYGVDIVPEFIAEAQTYNSKCLLRDHLLDTNFELVYSISVFLHLDDDQTKEALQYIYQRLLPGGKAYLQIPTYETQTSPRDFMDVRTWKADNLLTIMEWIGFEIETLWVNPGSFAYDAPGPHHNEFQVCIKS